MVTTLLVALFASGGAFVLLLCMALLASISQKLGRRYAGWARHEAAYLLLLMYTGVLLAVLLGYLLGAAKW